MTTQPPRTYKHQLTAEEFRFAFTATAEEFAARADEMRAKGVERLAGSAIRAMYGIQAGFEYSDETFTLVAETEILTEPYQALMLTAIQAYVPGLVLWRSTAPAIALFSCTLAIFKNGQVESNATSFQLFESTTGGFIIEQSTIGHFKIHDQSVTNYITVRQSTIGDLSIEHSTTGYFIIEQSTTGKFVISQSTTGYFSIGQSTTGYFNIREKSTVGYFAIWGQSTTGYFVIREQSTTGYFAIREQSTTGYFAIRGQSTTGNFDIEQSTTGNFDIEQSKTGKFTIYNSEVTVFSADGLFNSFDLTKATISQFRLKNCHLPELRIASGCRIECYIAHSAINLIDLQHLTLSKESVVSLFDCTVYACLIEEFAMLGSLFFRRIKKAPEPLAWYDPATQSGENGHRLKMLQRLTQNYAQHKEKLANELSIQEPTFRLAQSSLGKTEFTDCDLGGFRFEFNNAKITETFISGGTVPQENIFIHGETEGSLAWHEQKVSVYNQLKKIFDGQGDVYWATHFQAKTAEHQHQVLKRRQQQESEWFSTTSWDLKTFWLNNVSNRHGESWGRALLFTMGFGALFYTLFLLSVGRLFLPTPIDWELAGKYFLFLDPTHRTEAVFKDVSPNFGSYAADFLGRIVAGYGIYQLISAFRKHSKK